MREACRSPEYSGLKKIASQPSAISPASCEVPRPDRGEVDRQPLAHRVHGQPQRLARAVGQRQRPVPARRRRTVSRRSAIRTMSTYSRVRPSGCGEPHPVPALAHLRAGDAEAEPEAAPGQRVERGGRHRRHRGRPGRDLHHRGAEADPLGQGADPGQHGGGVRAVRLGRPGHARSRAGRPPARGRCCRRRCRRPSSRGSARVPWREASGVLPTEAQRAAVTVRRMRHRRMGRSGLSVSRLALGTMTWGRATAVDDARDQLRTFLGAGGDLRRHGVRLRRRRVRGGARAAPRRPRPPGRGRGLHQGRDLAPHRRAGRRHLPRGRCSASSTRRWRRLRHVHVDLWLVAHLERRDARSRRPCRRWSGR